MHKQRFRLIVALLLFVVVLLSGCQTIKYPETIADMAKLWENNRKEFDEFAEMILENIPDEDSELKLSYHLDYDASKWAFYYEPEDPTKVELQPLSNLINGTKIKAFIDKYSIFMVLADKSRVEFHVYKMSLADQPGHSNNYPSDNMKFVRFYYYYVDETKSELSLSDHWEAEILELKQNEGFNTLTYSVNSLKEKGYTFVKPNIEQISELPFLYPNSRAWKDNVSTRRNHLADFLYEIDDEHLLMIYEKDKLLMATLYNWPNRKEVQTVPLDLHGGLIGNYHVERLNENTFAYAAAMGKSEEAETLSLLTLEQNEMKVSSAGTLPVAGQWMTKGVSVNETLTEMAYLDTEENRLVWGDWAPNQPFVEKGSLDREELKIDAVGKLEQLHISPNRTLTYTWIQPDDYDNGGMGVVNLLDGEILYTGLNHGVRLTPTKYGVLLGEAGLGPRSDLPEEFENRIRYIANGQVRIFGTSDFSSRNRKFVPGFHDQYFAIHLNGGKNTSVKDFYLAWYDYTKGAWEQEVWVIEDTAFFTGDRLALEKTRPDVTYAIGNNGKRIYAMGFGDERQTVLNVIEMR